MCLTTLNAEGAVGVIKGEEGQVALAKENQVTPGNQIRKRESRALISMEEIVMSLMLSPRPGN